MSFLLGVLIFIFALLFSVMLHELGHFVTAKKFGMKVTQFFVGFGQTIWSRRKGETEYGIKSIPAGGFVKIVGMTALEDVEPDDEPRSFRRQPGWQRMIVLAAGSFMHFAFAFILLFGIALGVGLATTSSTATIGSVFGCVPKTATSACVAGEKASPAKAAGIRAGDSIVAFAGQPVHSWAQMGSVIRKQRAGTPVTVTILRDGKRLTLHISPADVQGHRGAFIGVSPVVVFQRAGLAGGISYAASQFGQTVTSSAHAVTIIPAAIPDLFAKNRASTPGGQVSSVVGVGDATGQVLAANLGWQPKVGLVLYIIASLNIFVGLFNLLPLLPMDGGHLAVVIYERIRAWLARLRGRPDPGLVDMRRLIPVSVGVFALLVGFSLLLIVADIVNPIHILQ